MRRAAFLALLACAAASAAAAQDKALSLDVLYDPVHKVDFTGTAPRSLAWLDEQRLHWPKTDPLTRRTEHFVIDPETGSRAPLFSADVLERELLRLPGVSSATAHKLARKKTYAMDKGGRSLVLEAGGDLYVFTFATGRLARLTSAPGKEEEPAWSPD